jgi:hypothetical protein
MTATVGAGPHAVVLAAGAPGVECPLLPAPLTALVSRVGSTWVDPDALLPRALLLWIDDARYPAPREWLAEARASGPAIPISAVPSGFALGETWVLVAHRRAVGNAPGIVHVFQPMRLDRIEVSEAA